MNPVTEFPKSGLAGAHPSKPIISAEISRDIATCDRLLREIRRTLDPQFRLVPREKYCLGRLLARWFPNTAAIWGHACYVPRAVLCQPKALAQLIAHEGVHLAQRRDFGWWGWHTRYWAGELLTAFLFLAGMLTSLMAVLGGELLIAALSAAGWMLFSIYSLVNKKTFPCKERCVFELEAYATAPPLSDWLAASRARKVDYFDDIYKLLCSKEYLWCGQSVSELEAFELFDNFVSRNEYLGIKTKEWFRFLFLDV